MSEKQEERENLLSSWKEISAYLDFNMRTCMRWEKELGLPIYRIGKSAKARVFAYKNELDRWRIVTLGKNGASFRQKNRWNKIRRTVLAFLILLVFLIPAFYLIFRSPDFLPAGFRIDHSALVILNKSRHELGRFETRIENLEGNEAYQQHFQVKNSGGATTELPASLPWVIIKDIDGDKRPEVLFCVQTQDEINEGILYCLDTKGKERWHFKAGREVRYGSKTYSADFRIKGFDVHDFHKDGTHEIVVSAMHQYDFPSQTTILDKDGKILGEYWNSGYLNDFLFCDLNGNGRDDLLLSGCNNESRGGCLAVFDPSNMHGCSPQFEQKYVREHSQRGTEKYYVLFPRSDVDRLRVQSAIGSIEVLSGKRLLAVTAITNLIYSLFYDMTLEYVTDSHIFQEQHRRAVAEGRVHSVLDAAYLQKLAKGFLYFNGQKFTPTPSMSNPW